MSWLRRLLVVLVCVGLMPRQPYTDAATPTGGLQIIGCGRLGYTMRIPATWRAKGSCTRTVTVVSADQGMEMEITAEPHAYWNDARTTARLQRDLRTATGQRIDMGDLTYNQHEFHYGLTTRNNKRRTPELSTELLTFQSGYLYAFYAEFVVGTDPSTTIFKLGNGHKNDPNLFTDRLNQVSGVWATIAIAGPQNA